MKKTIPALFLFSGFCALSLASCEKVKDKLFPSFDTDIAEVSVTIPVIITGIESGSSSTVYFNLDSTIKAYTSNTFGFKNLNSVKVKNAGIFLVNADDLNNVSSFEKVSLKLYSNTNTTPVVVASADIPNNPASNINITATGSPELKEYLNGNQLTYIVSGKARKSTSKPLNAAVSVTLSVK